MTTSPEEPRRVLENLVLVQHTLPEGDERTLNAWLVLLSNASVLIDAPFAPAVEAARTIADRGHPPIAHILTDGAVVRAGDAFEEITALFGVTPTFVPSAGDPDVASEHGLEVRDPFGDPFLERARIAPIRPEDGPGKPVLYHSEDLGGALFVGGVLVGPGVASEEPEAATRLEEGRAGVIGADAWRTLLATHAVRSVLPLVGRPIVDVPDVASRLPFLEEPFAPS